MGVGLLVTTVDEHLSVLLFVGFVFPFLICVDHL